MPARRTVAILCFISFIVMGITSSTLGPTLTSLAASINLPLADAGILRAVQQIGSVLATFAGGYLLNRYALRTIIAPSVVLMAIGLTGMIATGSLGVVLPAVLVLGVGTGVLNVAANVAVSTLYAENAAPVLSALHTCFGIGLFSGPLLAGFALRQPGTWRVAYIVPAVACIILAGLFALILAADERRSAPVAAESTAEGRAIRPAVLWLPLLPMIVLLLMYNGAGNGMSDWIAPHLQLVAGATPVSAAQIAALYGLALTTGRAIGVIALKRLGNLRVLTLGLGLAVLGSAIIVASGPTVGFVALGVAMVGLGFSPIYPTVIAMAGQQQPDNRGAVTGVVAGIASIGGILLPVLQGWVGGGHSGGVVVTLAASLIMVGALVLVYRVELQGSPIQTQLTSER